jgi:hypothetical protein
MTRAANAKTATASKLTNPADVKDGDLMALINFVKVKRTVPGRNILQVVSVENGMEFDVEGSEIIEQMYSADRFTREESKTKTELAEILLASHNVPFTVVFEKVDGTERTLRGRLLSAEPLLGRSNVADLDVISGSPLRQVDHRTLKSIIVGGVKYKLKK